MAHAVLSRYGRAATVSYSSVYIRSGDCKFIDIRYHMTDTVWMLWISIRINFLDFTSWISYKLHKGQYIILHCFVGFPRLSLIQHACYLTQNSVTSCLPFLIIPLRMWHCYIITDTTKQNHQIEHVLLSAVCVPQLTEIMSLLTL